MTLGCILLAIRDLGTAWNLYSILRNAWAHDNTAAATKLSLKDDGVLHLCHGPPRSFRLGHVFVMYARLFLCNGALLMFAAQTLASTMVLGHARRPGHTQQSSTQ